MREHRYGPKVHLLSDPYLDSLLARLCQPETGQPLINELVVRIYRAMLPVVVEREFPRKLIEIKTRMAEFHPEARFKQELVDPQTPIVTVNLARAGSIPSQTIYDSLNYFMNPDQVRQDHISIARTTNADAHVTGSVISGHKIGGTVGGAIVLIPDPMGATGGTVVEAVQLYQAQKQSPKARKYVALHCIVTPEYLKRLTQVHPDLEIYAIRLDRGLSKAEILQTIPGQFWDQERGLNEKDYIVPGGGGFGEIMNNAYA